MSENKESIKEEKIDEVEENLEIVDNEIKKLQEENSDLKDKWQRALADYQNLERRHKLKYLKEFLVKLMIYF